MSMIERITRKTTDRNLLTNRRRTSALYSVEKRVHRRCNALPVRYCIMLTHIQRWLHSGQVHCTREIESTADARILITDALCLRNKRTACFWGTMKRMSTCIMFRKTNPPHSANGVATHICERTRNGKRTTRVSSELFFANMYLQQFWCERMLRISALSCEHALQHFCIAMHVAHFPPCCGAVEANEAR